MKETTFITFVAPAGDKPEIDKIESLGGVIPCIESGFFQKEIAEASSYYQEEVDKKNRIIVGVNDFIKEDEKIDIPILEISDKIQREQINRLIELKDSRNNLLVENKLKLITEACNVAGQNLFPLIIDAAKSYATLGEIVDAMKHENVPELSEAIYQRMLKINKKA